MRDKNVPMNFSTGASVLVKKHVNDVPYMIQFTQFEKFPTETDIY